MNDSGLPYPDNSQQDVQTEEDTSGKSTGSEQDLDEDNQTEDEGVIEDEGEEQ